MGRTNWKRIYLIPIRAYLKNSRIMTQSTRVMKNRLPGSLSDWSIDRSFSLTSSSIMRGRFVFVLVAKLLPLLLRLFIALLIEVIGILGSFPDISLFEYLSDLFLGFS